MAVNERGAPPGERLGLSGWLRALGFKGSNEIAPPRDWTRQNVALISDESELTSFLPGPRGTGGGTQAGVAAEFAAFMLVAGATGARVTFQPSANCRHRVQAIQTFSATAPGPTGPLPLDSSDPLERPCTSVYFRGSLVAEPTVNAATFTATASWVGQPEIWVPPGRVLLIWAITAAALMHLDMCVREPGSVQG